MISDWLGMEKVLSFRKGILFYFLLDHPSQFNHFSGPGLTFPTHLPESSRATSPTTHRLSSYILSPPLASKISRPPSAIAHHTIPLVRNLTADLAELENLAASSSLGGLDQSEQPPKKRPSSRLQSGEGHKKSKHHHSHEQKLQVSIQNERGERDAIISTWKNVTLLI